MHHFFLIDHIDISLIKIALKLKQIGPNICTYVIKRAMLEGFEVKHRRLENAHVLGAEGALLMFT